MSSTDVSQLLRVTQHCLAAAVSDSILISVSFMTKNHLVVHKIVTNPFLQMKSQVQCHFKNIEDRDHIAISLALILFLAKKRLLYTMIYGE